MPNCSRLVGGLPLHVVLVLLNFAKCSKLSSLLVKCKLQLGDPNRQSSCGKPKLLPTNIVFAVASDLWPGLLFLNSAPGWPTTPWPQQYMVLHQVGWWDFPSLFHLGTTLPVSLLAAAAPPEWPDFLRLYSSAFRFLSTPGCSSWLSAALFCRPPCWDGGWRTSPLVLLGCCLLLSGW